MSEYLSKENRTGSQKTKAIWFRFLKPFKKAKEKLKRHSQYSLVDIDFILSDLDAITPVNTFISKSSNTL